MLVNVSVTDKHAVTDNEKVQEIIQEVEAEMNGNGRILVRPSGTEPLSSCNGRSTNSRRM